MPRHHTRHIVPYTVEQMFAVVADVEAYPHFLPHCSALQILSREKISENNEAVTARMSVRYKLFEECYTSRIVLDRKAYAIDVSLVSGPFSHLANAWRFEKKEEGTLIDFTIDYAFGSLMLNLMMGRIFNKMFSEMEQAFERRARELYGQ